MPFSEVLRHFLSLISSLLVGVYIELPAEDQQGSTVSAPF